MKIRLMGTEREYQITDLGKLIPRPVKVERIGTSEVGFIVAAIKDLHDVRIGDTVTDAAAPAPEALPGYKPIQQMVYCDFFPGGKTQYDELRDAMDRLQLNDSSFTFAPESSDALGFGFRCGFLGLLHMEIIQERLEREFHIDVVQTAPTVTYEIAMTDGSILKRIDAPSELPNLTHVLEIREPYILMNLIVPAEGVGALMKLCEDRRGIYKKTEYIGAARVIIVYELPLAEVIYDFYDRLKSATKGYGTMDYDLIGFRVRRSGEDGHPRQRRSGRRFIRDRPPRPRRDARPATAGAIERRNRQTPLRNPPASRHRRQSDRPRDDQIRRQKRHRQMLRRRRLPKTKAAGETKRRQETHEARRQRGYPAGGVHGDFGERGLSEISAVERGRVRFWRRWN